MSELVRGTFLVDRAGDHERRRRDRHRALGRFRASASASPSTTSAARRASVCASIAASRGTPRRSSWRTRSALARAGVHRALRCCPLAALDERSLAYLGPQRSIVRLIAATESPCAPLGDDVDLLIDVHTMFGPAESAYLGHLARALPPLLLRRPDQAAQPDVMRLVRDKVDLPIATGEQLAHKWEFQPLIENELVDYLRIDLVHAGGITEAKKILAAGEVHGQRSALHHASSPINGAACASTSTWRCRTSASGWMELEPLYELFPNAPRAEAGYVLPPTGPGLGLELDEAGKARRRPSRDARLPQRYWPDGSVGDY